MSGQDITPADAPRYLAPVMSADDVRKWRQDYEAIKAAALQDQDYFTTKGPDGKDHRYVKRSGLQILCNFFGVQDVPDQVERVEATDGSFVYRVRVRAYHVKTGTEALSWGAASSGETRFKNSAKLEHDVQATAETRARKRAQANMIGTYEVMQDDEPSPDPFVPRNDAERIALEKARSMGKEGKK